MSWGVEHLSVRFGRRVALDDVTLAVESGAVTAVVGGDGAGKTTLLRTLAGAVRPDAGAVRRPEARRLGFVSAGTGVYRDLTVRENLEFTARAYRVGGASLQRRAADLLARAGLEGFAGTLAGDLSGGMRQKLAFVLAVMHEPPLLVLDEPTTGVDPVSRADLWRLVAAHAAAGAAVVFSTTYLDEAERAAAVLVLEGGRALAAGAPDDIVAGLPGRVAAATERPSSPYAWRRGRGWRLWAPDGVLPAFATAVDPDMADAVIVAALARDEAAGAGAAA